MGGECDVLVAIGGNIPAPGHASVRESHATALRLLRDGAGEVLAVSRWYASAPVPVADQPDHVNGVALLRAGHDAPGLLAVLHRIEAAMGRERGLANAARTTDLDLIAHGRLATDGPGLSLPHPRLHLRRFVLLPLRDVSPRWTHPVLGLDVAAMLDRAPAQRIRLA